MLLKTMEHKTRTGACLVWSIFINSRILIHFVYASRSHMMKMTLLSDYMIQFESSILEIKGFCVKLIKHSYLPIKIDIFWILQFFLIDWVQFHPYNQQRLDAESKQLANSHSYFKGSEFIYIQNYFLLKQKLCQFKK